MTDQALLTELQYALLEPPDGGQSWPSEVWSRDDVLDAVHGALRYLLRQTHCQTTWVEQVVIPLADSVGLPADWLTTAHLVWRDAASNARSPLIRTDAFEADHGLPGWEGTAGTPIGYADLDTATLELRLVPTPATSGFLENLYVAAPDPVNGNGQDLPIPDSTISAAKYGALATLLLDTTRLQDPERAAYARERESLIHFATDLLLKGGA